MTYSKDISCVESSRMLDFQAREPGSVSALLAMPFQSLGNFVLSTTP